MRRPRHLHLVIALIALITASDAAAGYSFRWGRNKNQFLLAAGMRLFSHYVPEQTLTTPPRAFLFEGKFGYSFADQVGVYGLFGSSPATSSAEYGGGLTYKIADLQSAKDYVIRTIKIALILEFVRYSTAAPVAPATYESSGLQIRYGAGMSFGLSGNSVFLDTAFLLTKFSSNWCIAPFLGLKYAFPKIPLPKS